MNEATSISAQAQPLTMRAIFRFWLPLAATWFMMAAEGPLLAALIARLADAKFNLAAYGVAYAIALIVEAPVIMMLSAATALVADSQSYRALRGFNAGIIAAVTALMLALHLPWLFNTLIAGPLSLPGHVGQLAHRATILLLPWPGAIGFRRFYQGVMIRGNKTRLVAYGTFVRLGVMAAVGLFLYSSGSVDGAAVGALALSAGVTAEAIACRLMARGTIRVLLSAPPAQRIPLGFGAMARFYTPLALMSFLSLGIQPIITFFIGKSPHAIESLAVLPVLNSLVFVFRCVGLAFQDTAIANLGRDFEQYLPLRSFAIRLAAISTALLSLIAFTPLAGAWFQSVSGLSAELAGFAAAPLMIQAVIPATAVLLHFQHAVFMRARNTVPVTTGTVIEVCGIFGVLLFAAGRLPFSGAVLASIALVAGRLAANAWLMFPFTRTKRMVISRK